MTAKTRLHQRFQASTATDFSAASPQVVKQTQLGQTREGLLVRIDHGLSAREVRGGLRLGAARQARFWLARLGSELFRIGLHLALPVLTALLVCNLALGILTRAAPQLNLLSVGFPVTLLTGLWWLAHGMPWTVQAMQSTLEQWPAFLPLR